MDPGEVFWKRMFGAAVISCILFVLSWTFFRLIMATEDAFFGTGFFTVLRVFVLAGWAAALFFLYCLWSTVAFLRREKDDRDSLL